MAKDKSTDRGYDIREAVSHEETRWEGLVTCCLKRICMGGCGGSHYGFKWCYTNGIIQWDYCDPDNWDRRDCVAIRKKGNLC